LASQGHTVEQDEKMKEAAASVDTANMSVITVRLIELIQKMTPIDRQRLLDELEERLLESKRSSPRERYFKDVDFVTQDRVFRGFIQNISAHGVLIETSESFVINQELTLAFELPKTGEHIKVKGKIARILPEGGFGVKFDKPIESLEEKKKEDEEDMQ
jgi:Tfp pilus assembly protein PilZ